MPQNGQQLQGAESSSFSDNHSGVIDSVDRNSFEYHHSGPMWSNGHDIPVLFLVFVVGQGGKTPTM